MKWLSRCFIELANTETMKTEQDGSPRRHIDLYLKISRRGI